jgi:two-component system, NtrC family, sensor kinase
MKLYAKLVAFLLFGIVIFLGIDAFITFKSQISGYKNNMYEDACLVGFAMKGLVEDAWREKGEEFALKMIEGTNEEVYRINIKWVWLDTEANDVNAPRISGQNLKDVIKGKVVSIEKQDKEGILSLYTYVPVAADPERLGALEMSEPLSELTKYTHSIMIRLLILIVSIALLSSLVVIFLGLKFVGWPLRKLGQKIKRIGSGDLSGSVYLHGYNEFSELAVALNTMCDQLSEAKQKLLDESAAKMAVLERLREEDRLRVIGVISSEVAHELGTPLNVISGRSSLIMRGDLTSNEISDNAGIIKSQTERMTAIIQQLLDFSRRRSQKRDMVDLGDLARRMVGLLFTHAQKKNITLHYENQEKSFMVKVNANQIEQVLANLIINSLKASREGSRVTVEINPEKILSSAASHGKEEEYICLSVYDEGVGISKEHLPHIFEPFYSTKDKEEGTGLGLSIALGIVQEHKGWFDVKSEIGKGSCFRVYLPKES